jgi:hypothetical protein
MKADKDYVAAPPGEVYWRREVCPHRGKRVLLRTIGDVAIIGHWYGDLGQYLTAWSPLPKDGMPPPDILSAPLWARIKFAIRLIFQPRA